jgi:sortase A
MLDLDEQLAQLVDAIAEPVSPDEARARGGRRFARRRVGAGALALVLAGAVAFAATNRTESSHSVRVDTAPTKHAEALGTLLIPKIGVHATVSEGVDAETLKAGPGHVPDTARPGERGAVVVFGHRTTYGHWFYDLDRLRPDDVIVWVHDGASTKYVVTRSHTEWRQYPDELAAPTCCTRNGFLYLLTANPKYSKAQTLVVEAVQVGS